MGEPFGDDAYYYFALGQHLATSGRPMVDDVNLTNGFQPMWGYLSAIAYTLQPVRGYLILEIFGVVAGLIAAATAFWILTQLTHSCWVALFFVGTWWLMPQAANVDLSGMETPVAVLAAFLVLAGVIRVYQRPNRRSLIVLGAVSGFALLARVDLAIVAAFSYALLFADRPPSISLRGLALSGAVALLVFSPWLVYTLTWGFSPMPESGEGVRTLALIYPAGEDLSFPRLLILYLEGWSNAVFTVMTGYAQTLFALTLFAATVWLARRLGKMEQRIVLLIAVWIITTAVIYAAAAPVFWNYPRYALPTAYVFTVIGLALLASKLAEKWRPVTVTAMGLILAVLLLVAGYTSDDAAWYTNGAQRQDGFYLASEWLNEHAPVGSTVGAFQSGLLGYYVNTTVINLDGKVNTAAHNALSARETWAYICKSDIDYIADWQSLIDQLIGSEHLIFLERFDTGRKAEWTVATYQVDKRQCAGSLAELAPIF